MYNHAYTIQSIDYVGGQWTVTVYNVWGQDGTNWDDDRYDGVLTVSLDLFQANFSTLVMSSV